MLRHSLPIVRIIAGVRVTWALLRCCAWALGLLLRGRPHLQQPCTVSCRSSPRCKSPIVRSVPHERAYLGSATYCL